MILFLKIVEVKNFRWIAIFGFIFVKAWLVPSEAQVTFLIEFHKTKRYMIISVQLITEEAYQYLTLSLEV